MHILLIHQAFATPHEAGGTRHFELARYLISKGHNISVLTGNVSYVSGSRMGGGTEEIIEPGIVVHRVNASEHLHAGFMGRLWSLLSFMLKSFVAALRIENFDIVYGTSPPIFQGFTAYLISRVKRVPFVFEVRDLWPDFVVQVGAVKSPLFIYPAKWLEKFLYRKATAIIINSPAFLEHIMSKGIEEEKVSMVLNGVETSMFDPEARGESLREELGLEDKTIVLYAGAIGVSNDISTLLDAARNMRERREIVFLLVGGGNQRNAIEARLVGEGIDNVIMLPPVPKAEMPTIMAASDIGVAILKDVPMFKTVYPNKVFDYMAAGRAVLLAIDGVIRKVVEEAEAGVFVQPGNPEDIARGVLSLAEDADLREQMGRNGRKCVEECFERSEQAEQLERVLLGALRNREKAT
jgi:glycosyltransferase involved in cell wall biosynthesis